jgi:heme-degrading monooxygenase HmoA
MSHYTSGEWFVKSGEEDAFFEAFRRSGVEDVDPPLEGLIQRPVLLRDLKTEGRFVSFAEWESLEAIDAFRARPDWGRMVEAMRQHLASSNIFTLERVI